MISLWFSALFPLALLGLFLVLPVWIMEGPVWGLVTLAAGLLGISALNFMYLLRLQRWLEGPPDRPVPEGRGLWNHVFAGLHHRARVRREQQQLLSDALERFRRAVQAFPDGIIIFNQHRQIEWINANAAVHFQLDPGKDRGQALTNLIRQPDFVSYVERGDYSAPVLFPNPRRAGQTLLVQVVSYAAGENLLLSRDVSDQERLDVMRRDFVANVSHELKTPLTVVAGFAEMLSDPELEPDPAQMRHYMALIAEQTHRMQRLIEDLLTLSVLESTSVAQREEVVDLEPLLQTLHQEALVLSAGRHRIRLKMEGYIQLQGNPQELRSALGNLVTNAIRYTPAGGEIELRWLGTQGGGEFAVTDTGIGIAPEHIPRLTERFYRVDRGRSRETGGTGLGLAIVKHVLSHHQATLEVESQPGKGSRFAARFPAMRLRYGEEARRRLA